MLTFFAALLQKCVNSPSLKSSVSGINDDAETVGTDLQRANHKNMKKLTIASIPWIYSEHAHLLCSFMPENAKFSLFEVACLLDYWWCRDSRRWFKKADVGDMKKITITSIPWIYSEHAHLLCSFTPEMCVFPLFEVVCLRDYWWCGDVRCWFAKS